MYYYYYYYFEKTSEVTIDIKFEVEKGEPVALSEFNDFLSNINEINRYIIFLTQPEYKNAKSLGEIDDIAMLSYHQLELITIRRENPFFITLSVHLVTESIKHFWALWKVLIKICKKYGKTTKDLQVTLETLIYFLEDIYIELKSENRINKINRLKNQEIINVAKNEIFNKLHTHVYNFLKNKKAQDLYNSFCKSSITMTEIISSSESLKKRIDFLLNDEINEQK